MQANIVDNEVASNDPPDPVADCAGGNLDFEDLFCKHHQNMIRFVRRYVRTAEDAEDVVQNAFIEAIRCAENFAGLAKPSTWLFGIALNLARNHVRHNRSSLFDPIEESLLEQIADAGPDPADLIERREIARMVNGLLADLSGDIRDTFEAVLGNECTYKQAAEILQIPLGTVRSRISRVRTVIRKRIFAAE